MITIKVLGTKRWWRWQYPMEEITCPSCRFQWGRARVAWWLRLWRLAQKESPPAG